MTPEQMAEYEILKRRREDKNEKTRRFLRNRSKILASLPAEERQAYFDACLQARLKGERPPAFPGGRVSTLVEV